MFEYRHPYKKTERFRCTHTQAFCVICSVEINIAANGNMHASSQAQFWVCVHLNLSDEILLAIKIKKRTLSFTNMTWCTLSLMLLIIFMYLHFCYCWWVTIPIIIYIPVDLQPHDVVLFRRLSMRIYVARNLIRIVRSRCSWTFFTTMVGQCHTCIINHNIRHN